MKYNLNNHIPKETDLVVLGSGAAGMSAALTGAALGYKVTLIEKTDKVGGTTARSAGSIWIPNTFLDKTGNDNFKKSLTYLKKAIGNQFDLDRIEKFLKVGPDMVKFLDKKSFVKLRAYDYHPDYLATLDGATLSGRVLEPYPFDASVLGKHFKNIRLPLPEFMLFNGLMVDRVDISHLMNLTKNIRSFIHSIKILSFYLFDLIKFGRGARLVMGNALVGRLYQSLLEYKVNIICSAEVKSLIYKNNKVSEILINSKNKNIKIRVNAGVILATGGFSNNKNLRKKLMPQSIPNESCVVESATGDGIKLAENLGGRLKISDESNSFFAPISLKKRNDNTTAVFPHFVLDRGKPGLVAIDPNGKRFVNEATTYHLFGKALSTSLEKFTDRGCVFICDKEFIKKYGLGMVRPNGIGLKNAIKVGYVKTASNIKDLSNKIDVPFDQLSKTIFTNNNYAKTGKDLEFNKGEDAYQKNLGDINHKPNPCIGSIKKPPFYAINVYPGDIGASAGLFTNSDAQVLDQSGQPIKGLYACGNDMDSIMAGVYPGPGITIGPGMTFGYIAACHAVSSLNKEG
tara:strand:+ start:699 stop:2411 length:1713 start_codon:yes stop_codon:yes gene_type:complete